MSETKAPHKAVMALADDPTAHVPCPWCQRAAQGDPDAPIGRLEAYEQRVGEVRVIHIWCTLNDDHTTCVSGARETVFQGVPDLATRRPAGAPPVALTPAPAPETVSTPGSADVVILHPARGCDDEPPQAANDGPAAVSNGD